MNRTEEERREIARKSREFKRKNPKMPLVKIGAKFGISDSYVYKLWKLYPEEEEHDIFATVTDGFNRIEEEKDAVDIPHIREGDDEEEITGHLVSKNIKSFFNSIPIKMKIPAGLVGKGRTITIYSIISKEVEFIED